ncbi:MAG: alpha/beta hydrolase [Alistipes sp.]
MGKRVLGLLAITAAQNITAQQVQTPVPAKEPLRLVAEWDKTFPKSDKVRHEKVTFRNRFGITLAADLYIPKDGTDKMAAIAVSGPFGAVKEQASGLYAQRLAEEGFLTIAFDPSFTGESSGEPRYGSSMDINTEDFCAAVDYLSCRDDVDADCIGILGICGWGGIAINVAALDPRIKATVAVTLYNLTRVTQQGYFDSMDEDARHSLKQRLAAQRTEEFRSGIVTTQGGLPDTPADDAPDFVKQYAAYYKSKARGYHPRSLNSNMGWNISSTLMRLNQNLWIAASEVRSPVLVVHGEKAHSRYFGEEAYGKLTSGKHAANKRLLIVPDATHCDLYDGGGKNFIPWQAIAGFFDDNLKKRTKQPR